MDSLNTSFFNELDEKDETTKDLLRADVTKLDETSVYCTICEKNIQIDAKHQFSRIDRHIFSNFHIKRKIVRNKLLRSLNESVKDFHTDLVELFVNLNIPFSKFDNHFLKEFIKKHNGVLLKQRSEYKNILLNIIYPKQLEKNYSTLRGKNFYLELDGSLDRRKKNIYNVMGGVLNEGKSTKGILLESFEIEIGDAQSIVSVINYVVNKIHSDPSPCNSFKLFVSDGASSCLKAGKDLKTIFKSMRHVTCLAHFVHNLSAKIVKTHPLIIKAINSFTKIFKNSSKKRKVFKEKSGVNVEKTPLEIRFGTYFNYSIYLYNNWQVIVTFLESNLINSKAYRKCSNFFLANKNKLEKYLIELNNYKSLTDILLYVEGRDLAVIDVYNKIKELEKIVEKNKIYKDFTNKWLHNTADNKWFYTYTPLNCSVSERIYSHAPLNSIDCERSFSLLNYIITDKKTSSDNKYVFALLNLYNNK